MMRYARLLMGIWRNESRSCTVYHLSKSCHIYRQQLQVSQVQVCQQSSAQAKEPEQQLVTTRTAANDGNSHTSAIFLNCHMDRIFVPEHTHSHLSGYSSAHTSKRRPKFGHILVRTAIINFFFLFQKKHKTSWPMVPVPSSALKLGTEPQVLGRAVFPRKTATFVASQKRRCPKK